MIWAGHILYCTSSRRSVCYAQITVKMLTCHWKKLGGQIDFICLDFITSLKKLHYPLHINIYTI